MMEMVKMELFFRLRMPILLPWISRPWRSWHSWPPGARLMLRVSKRVLAQAVTGNSWRKENGMPGKSTVWTQCPVIGRGSILSAQRTVSWFLKNSWHIFWMDLWNSGWITG